MRRVRVGAVSYLNTRPLIFGFERASEFDLRLDVPAQCADLLHRGEIDLGLIPSIEYLRGDGYRIVPDISLASRGPVASVALYTSKPAGEIRSIALDTGSRTSVALLAILCARLFKIAPKTELHPPALGGMLASSDAALIIGDNALFLDHEARGLRKIDLGEAWRELTGLPFVYAVWAGHPGALAASHVERLEQARDEGVAHARDIADTCYPNDIGRREIADRYLRDNMKYDLDEESQAGLRLFHQYAAELGLVPGSQELRFYP